MNKLIVVTAALASVTLLSGCKHVVVHRAHTPDVVVDTRHHHEYRDVRVIRHEDPRVRRHGVHDRGRREVPPGHAKKRVVVKEKVVVKPPVRDGRFHREVERRSEPHKEKKRHDKQSRRREQHPPRREREHERERDRRDEGRREARRDEKRDHGKKRGKEKEQHARNREERFR